MRVIAINAFFRTGSSFLYDVFNQSASFTGLYEPLHPDIAKQRLSSGNQSNEKNELGHTFSGGYFNFYRQFSKECLDYGQLFRASIQPLQYPYLNDSETNYGLLKYLSALESESKNTIPVLQFNRSLFCTTWIRKNFPHWKLIHLYRNPRNIFCSLTEVAARKNKALVKKPAVDFWSVIRHLKQLCTVCGVEYSQQFNELNYYQHLYLLLNISDTLGKLYCDYHMTFESLLTGGYDTLRNILNDVQIDKNEIDNLINYTSEKIIYREDICPWKSLDFDFESDESRALEVLGESNKARILGHFVPGKYSYNQNFSFSARSQSSSIRHAESNNAAATTDNSLRVMFPRIAHLINPYPTAGEDARIQSKTIESIGTALSLARKACDVDLISFVSEHDFQCVPKISASHVVLEQSIAEFVDANKPNLPLFGEIVNRARNNCNAHDFLIFTNMDICLQPYFYLEVHRLIARGFDAFVINRRTIRKSQINDRSLLNSYQSFGESHPGHDCFVFRRDLLDVFYLLNHCIGAGFCFRPLLLNMILFSDNFCEVTDSRLTFHYGNDETWRDTENQILTEFNRNELIGCYRHLQKSYPEKFAARQDLIGQFFSLGFLHGA